MNFLENLKENMDFKHKVTVMPIAHAEMDEISNYITYVLYAKNAAKRLTELIEKEIIRLIHSPELYPRIEKSDMLNRKYRRIVVKNYIILYIVDKKDNIVYISHVYYGKRNYINNNSL